MHVVKRYPVALLLAEARTLARFSHPNITAIYDAGRAQSNVYVAMEYIEGRDLRTWLADVEPDWHHCLRMFIQAGRGLQAAHAAGIIHRDFKPDNVVVGSDEVARVLDFGLALLDAPQQEPPSTCPGASQPTGCELTHPLASGTPAYMPPEQIRGEPCDELGISTHTVHGYVKRLHAAFRVRSRGALVARLCQPASAPHLELFERSVMG